MAILDPIGQDTYNGLCVPLYGDSVLRQENSSNSILTLMHSTANTGRFILGIDYKADVANSSNLANIAVCDIDADGGFRGVSGTTVKFEMNSSGFYVGSTKVIDTSGGVAFKRTNTVTIDGTSHVLLSSDAGKVHMVSTGTNSSVVISLPTSATGLGVSPGMTWDIYCNTTASDVIDVASIGANTGAAASSQRILVHHGTTDTVETSGAISHDSSGPFWIRVMCLTTGSAPVYTVHNFMNRGLSTGSFYGLSAGSTALS